MTKDNKQSEDKNKPISSQKTLKDHSENQPVKNRKTESEVINAMTEPKQSAPNTTEHKGNEVKKNYQESTSTDRTFKEKNKGRGSGLALLAILIALGVGAGGYYLGQQQLTQIEQKLTVLETKQGQSSSSTIEQQHFIEIPDKLTKLSTDYQNITHQLAQLEQQLANDHQFSVGLKEQLNKLNTVIKAEPNDWILSEVDFLLNNALRKLVLDSDVDTAISLLQVASQSLEQLPDARIVSVRKALNDDLKQLLAVNNIDQNAIMQRLSLLANNIDELEILNVNFGDNDTNDIKLTDSMSDWKDNVKKSAVSFLNHFIRVTPRSTDDKALLAPNQDIYLRENIRLRLQIAILAVPRQQNELYKQSLEAVASWVRSYFNINTEAAKNFLQQVDNLMEQSIYVDVPTKLSSLTLLDQLLHRQGQEVQRIEIRADKGLSKDSEQQEIQSENSVDQQVSQSTEEKEVKSIEQNSFISSDIPEKKNEQPSSVGDQISTESEE